MKEKTMTKKEIKQFSTRSEYAWVIDTIKQGACYALAGIVSAGIILGLVYGLMTTQGTY